MSQKTSHHRGVQQLDRSILLSETGAPFFTKWAVIFSGIIIIAFLVWSSCIHVDEVAKANGELESSLPVHPIQHFYGGTIEKVLVKNGELVQVGTPLAHLNTIEVKSQLEEAHVHWKTSKSRRQRLEQLLQLQKAPLAGQLANSDIDMPHQILMLEQAHISLQKKRNVKTHQVTQLQNQIKEHQLQLQQFKGQQQLIQADLKRHEEQASKTLELLAQEKEALQEEMEIREDLVDQGLNSNIKFLSLQRTFYQLEKDILETKLGHEEKSSQFNRQLFQIASELGKLPLTILQNRAKIKEIQESLLEEESKLKEQTLAELDASFEQERAYAEQMVRLKDKVEQSTLKAPIKGYVHELKQAGPGSTLAPGEVMLNIIPYEATLIANIKVDHKDIGHLQVGQDVRIKLTSFDFSRYGSLPGKLNALAPNSSIDEKGLPYFEARVELLSARPSEDRSELPLKMGMSLDADIITGKKTIMEYLLKPIYASTREALQER